jgi:hypothetical protein
LILTGDADEVAGSPTEIAATIHGARYVSIPGTHYAADNRALDHPNFTKELLAFLGAT